MPDTRRTENRNTRHSEEVLDIITITPSWLLRCGMSLFFGIIVLIIGLSALIKYPDIVNAELIIYSSNSPKSVQTKISGKLVKLLVKDNNKVVSGESLAYIESTADHESVLQLSNNLDKLQEELLNDIEIDEINFIQSSNSRLGELQTANQVFYQEYLFYRSSINNGVYLKRKKNLEQELKSILLNQEQLIAKKTIQIRELELAQAEYEMHKALAAAKVETAAELRQQESKLLMKKVPLLEIESSIISSQNNLSNKQGEITELNIQISEQKFKFLQSLSSFISQIEEWKSKFILSAPLSGNLIYAGVIQENQSLSINQEIFNVNPENNDLFGQMSIHQNNMGKVKIGQHVLIKLKSYPFEEYGVIEGKIDYISDVPFEEGMYISKVELKTNNVVDVKKYIVLKYGMSADAEIITKDATVFQRIYRNFLKFIE